MGPGRLLALDAGAFRIALPLVFARQILDAGGDGADAPSDPRELGVTPIALATVLGGTPLPRRPALLLFDGHSGPLLLAACRIRGVIDVDAVQPLPRTVLLRWPGLFLGTARDSALLLVVDPQILVGVVEASLSATDDAPIGSSTPLTETSQDPS